MCFSGLLHLHPARPWPVGFCRLRLGRDRAAGTPRVLLTPCTPSLIGVYLLSEYIMATTKTKEDARKAQLSDEKLLGHSTVCVTYVEPLVSY